MYCVWISKIVKDQSPNQSEFSDSLIERAIATVGTMGTMGTMGKRHRDAKLLPHQAQSLVVLPSHLINVYH